MDRPPGLSVRLKLTLSYAGFLMVAGVLLIGVVWVLLVRCCPTWRRFRGILIRSDLLRTFALAVAYALAFLLVFVAATSGPAQADGSVKGEQATVVRSEDALGRGGLDQRVDPHPRAGCPRRAESVTHPSTSSVG